MRVIARALWDDIVAEINGRLRNVIGVGSFPPAQLAGHSHGAGRGLRPALRRRLPRRLAEVS
jgi:hypothetical protein